MTLREKHQNGQFTITVELDPPKSSSAQKVFEQAARLKGKVDAINIADSPMSKMRMSPISLSYLLQHNEGIETIFPMNNDFGYHTIIEGWNGIAWINC